MKKINNPRSHRGISKDEMQKRKHYLIRKNLHEKVNKPKPNIITDIATGASREITEYWDDPFLNENLRPDQQVRQSSLLGVGLEQHLFQNKKADFLEEVSHRIENRPGLLIGEAAMWGITLPIRGPSIAGRVLTKTLLKGGAKGAKVAKAVDTASNPKKLAKWATKPTTKHLGRRR